MCIGREGWKQGGGGVQRRNELDKTGKTRMGGEDPHTPFSYLPQRLLVPLHTLSLVSPCLKNLNGRPAAVGAIFEKLAL